MKLYKNKFLIFVMAMSVLVLIERVAPNTTINDRAIVVALAVDYEGEDLSLAAQIIKPPENGGGDSKTSSYVIIEGKAPTLGLALDQIGKTSGLVVSLSHCNLLLLGSTVLESEQFPNIDSLVTNWLIPDQAEMVGVEGRAADFLKKHMTMRNVSGFYIAQSLRTNREHIDVIPTMLKDFLVDYYTGHGVATLPMLSLMDASRENVDYTLVSDSLPLNTFTVSSGCALGQGKKAIYLDKTECRVVNVMLYTSKNGEFTVEIEGYTIGLRLLSGKADVKYEVAEGKGKAESSVKVKAILMEVICEDAKQRHHTVSRETEEQIRQAMKAKIEGDISASYAHFTQQGYDVFGLYGGFRSAGEQQWLDEAGDDYLNKTDFTIEVEASLQKTN